MIYYIKVNIFEGLIKIQNFNIYIKLKREKINV